jgi:Tol biopolymer transport system component
MPTQAHPETLAGTVMGTVGYMSPEQASGESLDFRSDQFSFGSIVYEMATGKKAFQRKTAAETMSAIIREQPEPPAKLRPDLPLPVQWILERCLSKDREERYASTKDLARDLVSVRDRAEASSGAEAMFPAQERPRRRGLLLAATLGVLVAGLAVVWGIAHGAEKGSAAAPSFKRLTFRQRQIGTARFAPDGQTIIYSSDARLYMTRTQSPESTQFPFPGDLLSISRSGELAILQSLRPVGRGILATAPMAGGAPRQVLDEVPVGGADWSPDGRNLVVMHLVGDTFRLESPIGKVIAVGAFGFPRFSADGNMISFWEQSGRSNSVGVIDRFGKSKKILSADWTEISGVPCWSAKGRDIWFTAGKKGERPALWRVDLSGRLRLAIRVPGSLELDDISSDGRVLLTHHTALQSVRGLGPGQSRESDLSWLDGPLPADLSQDGSMLLLNEDGEATGARPTIYLRGTDGSPALRLSEGVAMALSPDKQRVLAVFPAEGGKPSRLVLLPTGPGEPRDLPIEKLEPYWGAFTPDGKRVVFSASGPDEEDRLYVQEIAAGNPRLIGSDGAYLMDHTSPVSPDGRSVIAYQKGLPSVYPIDGGGEARAVPGLARADRVVQWSADSRSVYVYTPRERPLKVFLVDLATGQKHLWKEFPLDESDGRVRVRVTPDGRFYVYGTTAVRSELYLVDALR